MTGAGSAADRRAVGALAIGHACADMCQSAIPALVPFLVSDRHYSYAAVSALVVTVTVTTSMFQPLFGLFADRTAVPWLLPAGLLVGATGLGLAALAEPYGLTLALVAVSGLGVGAFHPEAIRCVVAASRGGRATGIGVFSIAGNVGFALGPAVVTPLLVVFGVPGAALGAIVPALGALVVLTQLRRLARLRDHVAAEVVDGQAGHEQRWGPFARLSTLIALRSGAYFGLLTFTAVYYESSFGSTSAEGNTALTIMLVAAAIGTLVGGRIGDRLGLRAVTIVASALPFPLFVAFLTVSPPAATVLLALGGLALVASFSPTVVMGQDYLPARPGMAAGITVGLAVGVGGLGAAALGLVADRFGLTTTMEVIAALPVVTLLVALTLPREGEPRAAPHAAPTAAPSA